MDSSSRLHVLVADSSPFLSQTVALALQIRGYLAVWALAREEADRILLGGGFDVLIAHGHFPPDGRPYQFAVDVASEYPRMVIVALSSGVDREDALAPAQASLLLKPFGLKQLMLAIDDALALRKRSPFPPGNHTHAAFKPARISRVTGRAII